MSKYVKQCEQCKAWKNFKDVKFFPAERETYLDGHVSESWNRYYCKDCMKSWDLADSDSDLTYEEASQYVPVTVERIH